MDAKQNVYEIQMECFKAFKAQNPDDFDVAFEIDGKKIYADKYKLTKISPTFKSMLSDLWTKPNESIKIENYKFEDFKQFLTFIYSGKCTLNDGNIFSMVDIAEFYGVVTFKKACDQYLSKMEFTLQNVFQSLEFASKYSLTDMKKSMNAFISKNFADFIQSEHFQDLNESIMKDIAEAHQDTLRLEEFFETVYQWAEIRAINKGELDESSNFNETIKEDLSDILPAFKFENMNAEFLIKFVVKKSFLFSGDKLSDILWSARGKVYVKIDDGNGKIMKGVLNCPDTDRVGDAIRSQRDVLCTSDYWKTRTTKPFGSSKLTKNDKIEWYLIFDRDGDLAIKKQKDIGSNHYLLAEMYAEDGFQLNDHCKITVYRYA